MTKLKTFIIVKNIPLPVIENLLKVEIVKKEHFNKDEKILVKMKNSKLYLIIFPNLITTTDFDLLYKTLASYTLNLVSPSEIVAVYENEFKYLKSEIVTSDFTIDQIFTVYKLNKGQLHVMLNLKKSNFPEKKWWEFWK